MTEITFKTVRRGMVLVDRYNQTCRVERVDRRGQRVFTRRREDRAWWEEAAEWTAESFEGRRWFKVQSPKKSPRSRHTAKLKQARRRLRAARVGPLSQRLFNIAAAVKALEDADHAATP